MFYVLLLVQLFSIVFKFVFPAGVQKIAAVKRLFLCYMMTS